MGSHGAVETLESPEPRHGIQNDAKRAPAGTWEESRVPKAALSTAAAASASLAGAGTQSPLPAAAAGLTEIQKAPQGHSISSSRLPLNTSKKTSDSGTDSTRGISPWSGAGGDWEVTDHKGPQQQHQQKQPQQREENPEIETNDPQDERTPNSRGRGRHEGRPPSTTQRNATGRESGEGTTQGQKGKEGTYKPAAGGCHSVKKRRLSTIASSAARDDEEEMTSETDIEQTDGGKNQINKQPGAVRDKELSEDENAPSICPERIGADYCLWRNTALR